MSIAAVRKPKALGLAMFAVLLGGMSCDRATSPPTTGEIAIALQGAAPVLDAARITISGPTSKTLSAGPLSGTVPAIQELSPGTYTVIVEGLIGGRVAWYSETAGVVVTRGATTTAAISLTDFRPTVSTSAVADTVHTLNFTVSYGAVPHATSYVVEWSKSPTMSGASSAVVTGTTHEIEVAEEGQYFVAVRAANAAVPVSGLPSDTRPVYVIQSVATVTVLPLSPTIADGTTQQFNAAARDAANNLLTGVPLFWVSSNTAVATTNQNGLVTAVGPGQTTITAVAKGIPGSATLTVTPLAPTKLVFTTPPTNTTAGQSISAIQVAIQNAKNQTAAGDNTTQITLAIAANPGSGVLAGTATATVVNGVATFNNLSINKSGTGYTLQATATSLTSATSLGFNITAAAASQLAWVAQPSNTLAGEPISPALQVEIRDALGNRVISARNAVTISFASNPGPGTLSGSTVVNAVDGIASFSGVSVDRAAAGYTLRASATSFADAPSSAFDIAAAAAAVLAFNTQPASTTTDGTIPVQVTVRDRFGNTVSSGPAVTVSIGSNPGAGTLGGTTTQPVAAGQATFNDLTINRTGTGYTLVARSGALATATSNAFDLSGGVPVKLGFAMPPLDAEPQGPINEVHVAFLDAHDNVTDAATDVTLALSANPGGATLSGTLLVPSVNGIAVFSDLSLDQVGSGYQLDASAAGVTSATSDAFAIAVEFVEVHAGDINSCGLTVNGNAYCWGYGGVGGTGEGVATGVVQSPVRVVGGHTFSTITTGYAHSCGIRSSDNAAICWGWGSSGQLGNGASDFTNPIPQLVQGGHAFVAISAGSRHTCGLDEDGLAWCWGQQSLGRLGNGSTVAAVVTTPAAVSDARVFASISAGYEHTCAVQASDRTAYCWGNQVNGRLGNNVIVGSIGTPQLVQGGLTFLSISAGFHTCAVRAPSTDRRGYCWGGNGNGQLGVAAGDFADKALPTVVANSLHFTNIDAGYLHSCGATVGGIGFCWGSADAGRLGNGEIVGNRETPRQVLGALTFTVIEAGTPGDDATGNHSCAMTPTGAYCWGENTFGHLGDGSTIRSAAPLKVRGQR